MAILIRFFGERSKMSYAAAGAPPAELRAALLCRNFIARDATRGLKDPRVGSGVLLGRPFISGDPRAANQHET
jgi:hypothetical protein